MNPIVRTPPTLTPHTPLDRLDSDEEKKTIQELVASNDFDQVEHYVNNGDDPHIIDQEGKNLMFHAGSDAMLTVLHRFGLDPDKESPCGFSAWNHWLERLKSSKDEVRASACSLITKWLQLVIERSGPKWKKRLADLSKCLTNLIFRRYGEHEIRWLIAAAVEGEYLFESLPGEKLCFGISLLSEKGLPHIHSRSKMGSINLLQQNSDGCTPLFYALIEGSPFETMELRRFADYGIKPPEDIEAHLLAAWEMACDPYHFGKILLSLSRLYEFRKVPDSVIEILSRQFQTQPLSSAIQQIIGKYNFHNIYLFDFFTMIFNSNLLENLNEEEVVKLTHMFLFERDCSIVTAMLEDWFNTQSRIVKTHGTKWLRELSQSMNNTDNDDHHLVNRVISHRLRTARTLARFLDKLPPELDCESLECPIDLRLFASFLLASNHNDEYLQLLSCLTNEEYCLLLFAALKSPLKTELLKRMGPHTNTNYPYVAFTLSTEQKKEIHRFLLSEVADLPTVQKALNIWMQEMNLNFLFLIPAIPHLSDYCRKDYSINKDAWESDLSSTPVHRIFLTLPIHTGTKCRFVRNWSQEQTEKLWDFAARDILLVTSDASNTIYWRKYQLDAVKKHIQSTLEKMDRQYLCSIVDGYSYDLRGYVPFVTKEAFDFFPENPKLSIRLFLSLQKRPDGTPLLTDYNFKNWKRVKESEARQVCRFLFDHPKQLTRLTNIWSQERGLIIASKKGKAEHTYHRLASVLLQSMQFKRYARVYYRFQEETELCKAVRMIMSGKSCAYRNFSSLLLNLVYEGLDSKFPLSKGAPNRQKALLVPGEYDGMINERRWASLSYDGPEIRKTNYYREYFFFMDEMADLLLSHSFHLANMIDQEGLTNWQDIGVVERLAHDLKEGHTTIVQAATGSSLEECRKFSNEGPFDWIRMAKQLLFWLQNDESGYLGALKRGTLPEELYPMKAKIDLQGIKNFSKERGFLTNGHKDIGPFSGPLCLTEFEKMAYATTIILFGVTVVEI